MRLILFIFKASHLITTLGGVRSEQLSQLGLVLAIFMNNQTRCF
uniref:Uncharacterized protein n=1 Tax=Rhizophora mucronata TaxID=61149 RepID=A0A2P2JAG1_RHIMU